MGLFDFFSGKKISQGDLEFLREVERATKMYFNSCEAKVEFKDKSGKSTNFIEAFPKIYDQCSQIKSRWDIRSMIYKGLDELLVTRIPQFIYANRLLEDRYVNEAFDVLKESGEPENDKEQYYCVLSRVYCILGKYDMALDAASKSLSFNPEFLNSKLALADAKHLCGFPEDAHEIYNQLMENTQANTSINSADDALKHMLSIEGNGIRSPILAVDLLKSPSFSDAAWAWAEDEFYFSPYFRCQHAYWLLQKKDISRAFAKLFSVVKEMPWVKEAAINTMEILKKLDPDGSKGIMAEDRMKLAKLIETNKWTNDGLYTISIEL